MQTSQKERPCVLVACEVRLYREGLAHFLKQDNRLAVFHECQNTGEVLNFLQENSVNAVLLDTGMCGALELAKHIVGSSLDTKVLVLGLNETEEEVMPFVESGVAGYVFQDAAVDDVVRAVLCALNEELICSRRMAAALQRRVVRLASRVTDRKHLPVLTRREREIARFLEDGLSNKDIAARTNISISTVKNHVHNILEKLHARSRTEAVAKCRELRDAHSTKLMGLMEHSTHSASI